MTAIRVDFHKTTGAIRPLHGINNGPVSFGSMLDNRHRFRELGVPWVRLHDTNWPHPREVDVPQIFPDFDADPDDPANYCFGPTDDYLRSILDTGARIIYRLGVSIEHYARKRYVFTPPDPDKWARICLGIVRHYTEGWADGIPDAVQYWEVWNEPDLGQKMWSGTYEDYLRLYHAAATTLKRHNADLKVGGPAACMFDKPTYEQFIAYCADRKVPLDFYSWHLYAPRPGDFVARARDIRAKLDAHGFSSTPSFLTEWNCLPSPWEILCSQDEYLRRDGFERIKNEEGAAFCAGTLIRMHDAPVDIMNYYDGQALSWFCGLFDYYGVPQKAFHAFKAFRELLACPARVEATCDTPGIDVLAGRAADGRSGGLLIANFGAHEGRVSIECAHAPGGPGRAVVRLVDRDHNLEPAPPAAKGLNAFVAGQSHLDGTHARGADEAGRVTLMLRRHAVVLVQFGCGREA